jgi:hypothetical protein
MNSSSLSSSKQNIHNKGHVTYLTYPIDEVQEVTAKKPIVLSQAFRAGHRSFLANTQGSVPNPSRFAFQSHPYKFSDRMAYPFETVKVT